MSLFTISGRFLIPGTRKVVTVKPVKMFFKDDITAVDQAVRQMIRPIEAQIKKELASGSAKDWQSQPREGGRKVKSVRLTEQFLKMNLQVKLVAAVQATPVTIPSIEEQVVSADWLMMVESDKLAAANAELAQPAPVDAPVAAMEVST